MCEAQQIQEAKSLPYGTFILLIIEGRQKTKKLVKEWMGNFYGDKY
jgi:hypothetical protein